MVWRESSLRPPTLSLLLVTCQMMPSIHTNFMLLTLWVQLPLKVWNFVSTVIGVSRSKPHTYHSYEKISVLMYVCMYVRMYVSVYVAIRCPRAHHTIVHV